MPGSHVQTWKGQGEYEAISGLEQGVVEMPRLLAAAIIEKMGLLHIEDLGMTVRKKQSQKARARRAPPTTVSTFASSDETILDEALKAAGMMSNSKRIVGDIGDPQLVDPRQFHVPGKVGVNTKIVIGIRGGHYKLAPPQAKQVVFAHDAPHSSMAQFQPATILQFFGDAWAAIIRKLQSDTLNLVAQIQIIVVLFLFWVEPIEPCALTCPSSHIRWTVIGTPFSISL